MKTWKSYENSELLPGFQDFSFSGFQRGAVRVKTWPAPAGNSLLGTGNLNWLSKGLTSAINELPLRLLPFITPGDGGVVR